jgi:hypothetical protein
MSLYFRPDPSRWTVPLKERDWQAGGKLSCIDISERDKQAEVKQLAVYGEETSRTGGKQ